MKKNIKVVTVRLSDVKRVVVETIRRVGYEGFYFLIVPDAASGRRGRYTVYKVPSSPSRRIRIVGRELPLGHARRIANGKI